MIQHAQSPEHSIPQRALEPATFRPLILRRAALACLAAAALAAPGPAVAQTSSAQAKLVALNGRVEHTVAAKELWTPARMLQPLLVAERVRTLEASRAAILFVDETQVKLNAGAILTIREVRSAGGPASSLELQRGEAWFRTKNPRSGLTIATPAAAAAIRGTEINLRVGDAGETTLTVVEGAAELSNPLGAILVNAGEEGLALVGQAPTKRTILNPEDAVQWALYYPVQVAFADLAAAAGGAVTGPLAPAFDRLRAGDAVAALPLLLAAPENEWARLGASIAYLNAGDAVRARDVIASPFTDAAAERERRSQVAAIHLANGDVSAAVREIDAALAQDPAALRPLLLLSSIELRRNRTDAAHEAAARALSAHPRSVGALIAASEAAQSQFDLDAARGYLDRALAIDPRDVHALVNRARIRFGSDDTGGAAADAAQAAAIAPDDPQVYSLRGFIQLAEGDVAGARSDFEQAIMRDPAFGEPHLGLGLVAFREGQVERGLEEMLTATLLEPKVSLYQSYLGKAYYQAHRFSEGLATLASAKRLDPRDPTPWLYTSFFLRDLNRQVDALNELRRAIDLNDHRAVYRSRLLLDRDLATKNVSLAQIYRQLGFEAWGASEALNSLNTDLTNSSAHLFLAGTYSGLPDRTEAVGSELLQYYLYAPVNPNAFNNFGEYTALLEQPRQQLDVTIETGTRGYLFGNIGTRGGNERFAHSGFLQSSRVDGARPNRGDDDFHGFFQGKLSFTPRSDMFFSYSGARGNEGASELESRTVGDDVFNSALLRQFTLTPDPTLTTRYTTHEVTAGLRHQWRRNATFTAAARYQNFEQTAIAPSTTITCSGFDLRDVPSFAGLGPRTSRTITDPIELVDLQLQHTARVGAHQVIAGHQQYTLDKATRCNETISFEGLPDAFDNATTTDGHDYGSQTYLRDEIRLTPWLHAVAGITYQRVRYFDSVLEQDIESSQWNPRGGITARLSPHTLLRVGAFRQLHTNLVSSHIAPPTVAGFVIARNEFPTTTRSEVSAALEHQWPRVFLGGRGFLRKTRIPYLLEGGTSIPDADADGRGGSVHLNWIVHPRLTVFADDQLIRFGSLQFDRHDNLVRAGINMIDPSGFAFRVAAGHVTQRFVTNVISGLPRSDFTLVDARLSYEFAGKRGLATVSMFNTFNQRFVAVIDNLSIGSFVPRRRVIAYLSWRIH